MWTKTVSLLSAGLLFGIASTVALAGTPHTNHAKKLPKNCQFLKEVATNQTHIRKSINSIIGNNFDTDFAVPPGVKFSSFKGVMVPENDGTYGVTINLKYADNSVSTAFRKDVAMKNRETYSLAFNSPTDRQPFQINLNINGNNQNTYTIAVIACR